MILTFKRELGNAIMYALLQYIHLLLVTSKGNRFTNRDNVSSLNTDVQSDAMTSFSGKNIKQVGFYAYYTDIKHTVELYNHNHIR